MEGFGVHTSMWTMHWDRAGAEKTIPSAAAYKMDFIEIALLNTSIVDAAHTRALLEKHNMRAVCSLGLPEKNWASVNPEGAIEQLCDSIDKAAEMGAEALSGVTYGGIGQRTGLQGEADRLARRQRQAMRATNIDALFQGGLHEYLGRFLDEIADLDRAISHQFRFT